MKFRILVASLAVLGALVGCIPLPDDFLSKKSPNRRPEAAAPTVPGRTTSDRSTGPQTYTLVPGSATPAPAQAANINPSDRLWVVVRNLAIRNMGITSEITADWEVVQGSPEPGAEYVLRVSDGDSGSIIEHYVDFDVDLNQRSGKVSEGVRGPTFGLRGGMIAVVGKKGFGRDGFEAVSGKARPGGQSEATPPPTVAEAAGSAAQGLPVAIANPRRESDRFGPPGRGYAVDYEVQGSLQPGQRYYWIVKDSTGEGVEFDVTSDLTLPGRKKSGTFSGSSFGPARLSGQLQMYIERRSFGRRSDGEIVSNTVTLN
jgi:hypothetical protein